MHVSFAITSAIEGFYPKNNAGYTIPSFTSLNEALPLIKLITGFFVSSFGMTKFFLSGPMPILPKTSPLKGIISLPFVCMLLINSMFGTRLISIESALFTSYRHQHEGTMTEKRIDPIIDPEYRLTFYLLPSFVSFIVNAIRLFATGANVKRLIRKYPQFMIACCFTPFMFQGCKQKDAHSLRIWKTGTILNAFYIGCLPQIVLLLMNYHRGIASWDFIDFAMAPEKIFESSDALIKSRIGNSVFAIITALFFLFLILLTFLTEKIFGNRGIYCKCCSILCLPCPNSCLNLKSEMSLSPSLKIQPGPVKDDHEFEMVELDFDGKLRDIKESDTVMHFYSKRKKTNLAGKPLLSQDIELKEVNLKKICYIFIHVM